MRMNGKKALRRSGLVWVLGAGSLMLAGCSSLPAEDEPDVAVAGLEAEQGLLGDLNQYVQHLLGQQASGNGVAEQVLVRMLSGRGLPEPVNPVEE